MADIGDRFSSGAGESVRSKRAVASRTWTPAHRERLLAITTALADAVTPEEVYAAIVDDVHEAVGALSTGLWLLSDHGNSVRLVRNAGYADRVAQMFETFSIDRVPTIPALDVIRRRQALWISSQQELLRDYPQLSNAVSEGIAYRVSCLPLATHERVLGSLGIAISEDKPASEDEQSFLLLVARYATQALERLRLLDAERRSREKADATALRMTLLSYASRAFSAVDVLDANKLDSIVRELGMALDCSASIAIIDGDYLRHVAYFHPDKAACAAGGELNATLAVGLGEGISGKVAQTGARLVVNGLDAETVASQAPVASLPFLRQFPVFAAAIVPMRVGGRIIGTISAMRVRPGQSFADEDVELFEALADRAGSTIENCRLHQESENARLQAEQLYGFAGAAMASLEIEQVLHAALDAITNVLHTERASILLFDESGKMRFKAWRGLSDGYRAAVDGHSPWSRTAKDPEPVVIADALGDSQWTSYAPLFHSEGIGALAFIPLVSRGTLLGKFMIYYRAAHQFTEAELAVARAIANFLGSVIARFQAIASLERTVRDNELFAGALAHDLRNPLNAITFAAHLVRNVGEGIGDRVHRPISHILSSTDRMARMIDQLLDFTRARVGGGIVIERCSMRLGDVVQQSVSELELVHPERRFETSVVGDHDGVWDPDRLLQVVSNLVANAAQHGSAGAPIQICVDGRESGSVAIRVQNGGAIPEAHLPTLFDPFRGRDRRRGSMRGLGLGLFIVREIVQVHGGTVEVNSSKAEGTVFTVVLPRA